jgi:hypothetical protein
MQNISNEVMMVWRSTHFANGALIAQKYFFNSTSTNVEDFPINETLEIQGGTGLTLRHETTNLAYSGPNYGVTGTGIMFGKMKIEFPDGYSFGRVYSTGRLRLDYALDSYTEQFEFRMYDPAAPTNITIYLNDTVANRTIEIGEPLNITAKSNVTGLSVCLSVNHSYLGDNFLCNTTTVTYIFNPTSSTRTFNDSTTSKNLNYSTTANQTVYIRQNTYDEINSVRFNLTGVNTSGSNYPANVKVYVNNTLAKSIPGTLKEGASSLTTYNDSSTYKTFIFYQAGSQQAYFLMNKNAVVTDAYSNVSGSNISVLDINGTTVDLGGDLTYDVVHIHNGGTLQINGTGYVNFTKCLNFTIDSTSKILSDGTGYSGGAGGSCPTESSGQSGSSGTGPGYGLGGGIGNSAGGGSYGGLASNSNGTYGTENLLTTEKGSGGGGGACQTGSAISPTCSAYGGAGGSGGGTVRINSTYIQISGTISVNGTNGGGASWSGCGATSTKANGGGGGSGGGVLIIGKYVSINNSKIFSYYGAGGAAVGYDPKYNGYTGAGGRIKIFYENTFTNGSSTIVNGGGTTYYNTSSLQFYLESEINIGETYYPTNPYIDIESDGDSEWSYTGTFNQSNNKTANFSDSLNHYLSLCTADADGNCVIPIAYGLGSAGVINSTAINISLTVYFNPITINNSYFQNFLDLYTSSSYQNIPIKIEANQGNVTMNGINISYNGTGILNITASYAGNATYSASSSNKNLTIYHSNFVKAFPYSFMTEPIFLPVSVNSTNVSMYGQTASKPGYNITGKGYSSNFNVSIRLNQSMDSCMNMTVGNADTTFNFTLNTTRRQILSNITLEQSAGLWLKLNLYNCNASTIYRNWWVELKSCCYTCMACW